MTASSHTTQVFAAEASALAHERRKPLVGRMRFQLGGALLAGMLLPLVLRWPLDEFYFEIPTIGKQVVASSAASAIAIVLGYILIRQFVAYPGARATTYILPGLSASFGLVVVALFFTRMEYSRYMILASFIVSVCWLYVTLYLRNRSAMPLLALVPTGNHRDITSIPGARWLRLTVPKASLKGVEAIVADLHADLPEKWQRFIAQCTLAGIPVHNVKNVIESLTGRVEVEHLAENSFGSVLPSRLYLHIKRGLDVLLTLPAAPFFLAAIAVAAIFIRLESRGSVFYTQPRMGLRGSVFKMYKLRSMHMGDNSYHFTGEGDPRVTKVGWYLRKYRVDEFPQIFNIIRGEMSWIGPRPEPVTVAEYYAKEIPFYIYRHAVRPGVSGWAQVNQGYAEEVEAGAIKLQYDFYYIKNFSAWLDLLILLKTLKTMLTGFGSR